jgi:peptidoglycan/LPS O-acetylase OafA/YrhL
MSVESTPAAPRDRAPELDLLRFVAASLVVVYHYAYRPAVSGVVDTLVYGGLQDFAAYGYLGVQLFFLISGFVIVWSAAGRRPAQFLRSRFLRLYPMFWVGVALTMVAVWLGDVRPELFNARVILANLTLLPAYFDAPMVDGVYWTLAIELKFYLLIFFAMVLRQMPHIERWMYVWLAACVGLSVWPVAPLTSIAMLPHGFFFVGGAICYFIRVSGLDRTRVAALLVAAAGSAYHAVLGRGDFTFETQVADPAIVAVLIVAFYGAMLSVAMRWVKLSRPGLWMMLGALTYPLYLLHNMLGRVIMWELESHTGPWARLFIVTAIVYMLAWACARWIEPATRDAIAALLDRWRRPRQVPGVAPRAGD